MTAQRQVAHGDRVWYAPLTTDGEVEMKRKGWSLMEKAQDLSGVTSYRYEKGGSIWKCDGKWRWHLEECQPFIGEEDTPEKAADRVERLLQVVAEKEGHKHA